MNGAEMVPPPSLHIGLQWLFTEKTASGATRTPERISLMYPIYADGNGKSARTANPV